MKKLVIIPSLVFLLVFFYMPVMYVIRLGLNFESLRDVLTNEYHLRVIGFTFIQAALSTLLTLAIGLPGAYIFARYEFPGKSILKAIMTIPFVMPSVMVALGFIVLFGKSGPLGWMNVLYSWKAIILAHAFYNFPVVVRMVSALLERVNPHYEEAAMTLGAKGLILFRKITLPLILPGILSSALLTFTFSFMSFSIPLILGGYKYTTLEVDIFTSIMVLLDFKTGSSLALLQMILSLIFIYAYLKTLDLYAKREEQKIFRRCEKPKGLALIGTLLYFLLTSLFILGPLVAVLYDSLAFNGTISLEWYRRAFSPRYNPMFGTSVPRTIVNSLFFGIITVTISLLVAIPLSYSLTKWKFRGKSLVDALATLPLASSPVILGLGYLLLFRKSSLYGSWILVGIAHSIVAYPFVLRAVSSSLVKIRENLFEAALTLGAKEFIAFFKVELPLALRGIIVGAIFAFAISIAELATTYMLAKPEYTTLTLAIYKFISSRQFGPASALATILMIISGISFILIEKTGEEVW
ncbi:iron ABC transporter permease [Pyrococcus sp. ST04]|uniref:ABC transporter permease n=1 Tax=Pyrococcus sp. ST04 TaxID=1183377 RepID=UPI0002605AFE|nr:iron ABC transporter permease [Pyrococcus sp. ST04]AFK22809.1 iron(III) ABC transporter permease [Pyrococcus sp. ST04]